MEEQNYSQEFNENMKVKENPIQDFIDGKIDYKELLDEIRN